MSIEMKQASLQRFNRWSYIGAGALLLFTLGCGTDSPTSDPAAGTEGPATSAATGHHATTMGDVDFQVSCADEVSDDFDQAVMLLHHMHYEESRAAFEAIAAADAECAMAHWGVAMTLFQPLWPSRPSAEALQRGWQEIQTAKEIGTGTDREADLLAAAEAFYQEPDTADWWTRIGRWKDAMATAHEARPDDIETSAFYALSQLAAAPVSDDRLAHNDRAGNVLHAIWEKSSTHPGAIHYTIHANDVDTRAGESLEVVGSYSQIAPDVPHALHMPTHIYVRLGDWPEVIDWNVRSAESALRHPAGDAVSHHYPHAIDYLVYAYLQRGEDAKALAAWEELSGKEGPFQPTFISAFHLASSPARYAVERRAWTEAAAIEPRTPAALAWDNFWWAEAISWFARGLGALNTGDTDGAAEADGRMASLRDAARDAGEQGFANYIEIDRLVLASWRAWKDGDGAKGLELAREAVALEGTTQKHPVTPGALYPSGESLGDLLREMERPAEALAAYEASLVRWPGRLNTLDGAIRAAQSAGDAERAAALQESLAAVTDGAEVVREGLVDV